MQDLFIEFLPPWVETGLQPAFYDRESGTVLQQTARMYAKVNELVKAVNGMDKVIKEYVDYIDNYFKNLDVQEEINNKLDDMAEKGELASYIAQFLAVSPVFAFETISDMTDATNLVDGCIARVIGNTLASDGDGAYYVVKNKEPGEVADGIIKVAIGDTLIAHRIKDYTKEELLEVISKTPQETAIALSWYISGGVISSYICYSNDGINWKQVALEGFGGRDPSFVYDKKRKCFYLTKTPPANQSQTFTITKTTDFVHFTDKVIQIGAYYGEDIMAPDLYMDEENDQLIVHFSYSDGTTTTDVDGQTILNYSQYRTILGSLDDFDNLSVEEMPTALTLTGATNGCIIDGNIIKDNGLFYLNCKDDVQKVIQVYVSSDGLNYTLLCPNILNNNNFYDNSIYIEGGCWYKFNDEFYLIADAYAQYHNLIVGKTKDFIHFNFTDTNMWSLRHPSVVTVEDDALKLKMSEFKNFGYSSNEFLNAYPKPSAPARHLSLGFNGEISAIPGMTFTAFDTVTITDIKNPFHCDSVKFMFGANPGAKITINKINGVTVNKVLINSSSNNEKCIEISLCPDINAFPLNDFQNVQELDTTALQAYFTAGENISITGGSAYKQGNIVSLSLIITTSAELNGYKTIFTKASNTNVLTPANKVVMNNEGISSLDGVSIFSETGAIVGTFHNLPAGNYTLYATYFTK